MADKIESTNLQTTDFEEWEEIGEYVKQVNNDVTHLVTVLNSVPKSVWGDEVRKADDALAELKNILEERMFQEHPEKADMGVFYGEIDDEGNTR